MRTKTPPKPPQNLVVFNYNGETWDAHEVLGADRADSLEQVTNTYSQRLQEMGDKAATFLKAAYDAILKSNSLKS